jgi:hypothetical protein
VLFVGGIFADLSLTSLFKCSFFLSLSILHYGEMNRGYTETQNPNKDSPLFLCFFHSSLLTMPFAIAARPSHELQNAHCKVIRNACSHNKG